MTHTLNKPHAARTIPVSDRGRASPSLFFLLAALAGLAATGLYSFLLFHASVELARAITLLSISGLAWASWRMMDNGYLLIYGSASFFAAIIVVLHTLAYKGMGIFPSHDANLPTQLWVASRFLESVALLLAGLFINRKPAPALPAIGFAIATALLLGTVFGGVFPDCFVEGEGLTPFKIASEYAVMGIFVAALVLLLKQRQRFEHYVSRLLVMSIVCAIAAEMAFTLYTDVHGITNMVGHLFVFAAAYLAYWAILIVGVRRPQEILFRELAQREELLEHRVAERTAQLEQANRDLAEENTARRHAEAELTRLNTSLEQRVIEEVAKNRDKDMLLIQQSRLATMGEMLRNIAHHWRQPLNALALVLANIKDAHEYGELDKATMNSLVAEGASLTQRMSATIDEFRDFFYGDNRMTDFSLAQSVQRALSIVGEAFMNEQVEVKVDAGEEIEVHGYANEFSRVLLNLLTNAKEAIRRQGQGGEIHIAVGAAADRGTVSIRDSGGGIPPDTLPRIFDPYFTTKESGTGLGLYMAKKVMENMGGAIEGRNVGQGAEFTVSVPLAKKQGKEAA